MNCNKVKTIASHTTVMNYQKRITKIINNNKNVSKKNKKCPEALR